MHSTVDHGIYFAPIRNQILLDLVWEYALKTMLSTGSQFYTVTTYLVQLVVMNMCSRKKTILYLRNRYTFDSIK
jgi:hypothetical protein